MQFFCCVQYLWFSSDNVDNITVPIILTILASDQPTEELRMSVQNSLVMFDLLLLDFEEDVAIVRFSEHRFTYTNPV